MNSDFFARDFLKTKPSQNIKMPLSFTDVQRVQKEKQTVHTVR